MEQQTYTIREMSERFGLPASTLRYYEEIGLLTDVIHTESKKRIYCRSQFLFLDMHFLLIPVPVILFSSSDLLFKVAGMGFSVFG